MLGCDIYRLPSEAEWEAAGRGRGAWRRYAWLGDIRPLRANTAETRLGVTTPVGVFPDGTTPDSGLLDLCGNVWEWTATPWLEGDAWDPTLGSADSVPRERRVVRGGSWNNTQDNARLGYRNNNDPDNRNNDLGFRVYRASHIISRLLMAVGIVCGRRVQGVARFPCASNITTRPRLGVAAQSVFNGAEGSRLHGACPVRPISKQGAAWVRPRSARPLRIDPITLTGFKLNCRLCFPAGGIGWQSKARLISPKT